MPKTAPPSRVSNPSFGAKSPYSEITESAERLAIFDCMTNARQRELMAMDLEELLDALSSPEPGSVNHELTKALIQARIAGMQRETARESLRWARLASLATAGASAIALTAFLVAIF